MGRVWVICKKVFSVSLVFNALLTICFTVNILSNHYWFFQNWQPYEPYLVSANLLWLVIAAGVINIFPSASLGRSLHTGRFLFHHYLYGFIVLASALVYVALYSPIPLTRLFFVFDESIAANVGRFFILGGLALVLDDLTDVSSHLESWLNRLKAKVGQWARLVTVLQLVCGAGSFYSFAAVTVWVYYHPEWLTIANGLFAGTLFITGVTSLIFVRRQVWHKINLHPHHHKHA